MDIGRVYTEVASTGESAKAAQAWYESDKAIADAAERITCADLLERLGKPSYDHTPDGVMRAIDAAVESARYARDEGITRATQRVSRLEAECAALRHLGNELAAKCERAEAAEDAEEKLERMRGSAEPIAYGVKFPVGWVTYSRLIDAEEPANGRPIVPLYAHPPAAPSQPAERPIQVGDRVRATQGRDVAGRVVHIDPDGDTWFVDTNGNMAGFTANALERVDD